MLFDAPIVKGPFKKRLAVMTKTVAAHPSQYMEVLEQTVCKGQEHLTEHMDAVLGEHGEGIMIKDSESVYEGRRSHSILKVKKFEDAEATVVGHQRGSGRCSGMLGALEVRTDDGVEFKIGSGFNDAQRRKPPKIGSIVTYKFMGLSTYGKPRHPIYLRQRQPGL